MNTENPSTDAPAGPSDDVECPHCRKPAPLCVCDGITPIDNRIFVLVLQHPQEQDRALATARLTTLHFKNAALKIGLSWPSLTKVLGQDVDPQRWAVLYLGSVNAAEAAPGRDIVLVDKKGAAITGQDRVLRDIEGVILLDGTWSQAKALWWRNAWMLKCRRAVLGPAQPSRYGRVRREPRRDALSTIESAAMLVSRLERRPEIETTLAASFDRMLAHYRDAKRTRPDLVRR
jgi:DTW domain-containing protein